MNRREWSPRLAVVVGYVAIAMIFTWPLVLNLGTALTGDPGGDTGVYVWNQWVFQHEATTGHNPLSTEQILSLSRRVDLSQHNYTAFLNLLALPLIPWLGVVVTFNLVFLIVTVLTACCAYALARRAFETTRLEAFIGGLAFGWSPVLVARSMGHFSLVAAAPLAAFLLTLSYAERTRSTRHAALAGLCMAWAAFCDAYYAVFCLMMAGLYIATSVVRVSRRHDRWSLVPWMWLLDVLILSVAGLVVGLALGRGANLEVAGIPISVRGLYTPVLILTLLVVCRIGIHFRPSLDRLAAARPWLRPSLVAIVACAGPLSPVLYGLGQRVADGRFVNPPTYWRSSPRGVDLLAFFHPNPNHAISRWLIGDGQATAGAAYVEYTAAFSLVALGVVGFALLHAAFRPKVGWWWLTIGFASLALGPFVIVSGINTFVPGPWALLRYVPIAGAARTPTRFSVVAALGLAMLLAGALVAIGQRWPHRRRQVGMAVLVLLMIELFPAPRRLYSAGISPLYDIVAADARPVRFLSLPFGVRDGVSSAGNFSARYQFNQTRHKKRLIGGYLSRVSRRRLEELRSDYPVLSTIITMSEGHTIDEDEARVFVSSGAPFVDRVDLGYVAIEEDRVTPQLESLAIEAFGLEQVARDGTLVLYRPRTTPLPTQPR
jgi:hypothetical protein